MGPWQQPRDLQHCLELIQLVQRARRGRTVMLGRIFAQVAEHKLYRELGYGSLLNMARQGLDISVRSLERYRALAQELEFLPQLGLAIEQGLDLGRAWMLANIACEETIDDWLFVARHTGKQELQRAIRLARHDEHTVRQVLDAYRLGVERALELLAEPASEPSAVEPDPDTTQTGDPSLATRVFVSLNLAWAPPKLPAFDCVHADLPAAAAWFVENVVLDPQSVFGEVKERDDWTCRNPECGRQSIRVQAHHIHFRSLGGDDSLGNGITVCPVCHLRLIHTGIVSVRWQGGALVWRFPGRVVVAL